MPFFRFTLLALLLVVLPVRGETADTFATALRGRIDVLLQDDLFERSQVGVSIYDLTADRPLYSHGARQCMRPASCMKVLTATSALAFLGTDYHYETRLYALDSTHLAIRGGMDPLFGPEDMHRFITSLKEAGIRHITEDIILDASIKDTTTLGWGWCWDDKAVPLTPFLYNGKAGFESALRYALSDAGIPFLGGFVKGRIPGRARPIASVSHPISAILQPMMKESDNLFAETLFYQLGALGDRVGATYKDAARRVQRYIELCGHAPDNYVVADGSGLSLYNYVSPQLLVDALRYAYRHDAIYATLLPSLPVMGRDGTLSSRCIATPAQGNVRAKTGTVSGVSSLAGYATTAEGHIVAFAIINQGVRSAAVARKFQDAVCCALTSPVAAAPTRIFAPSTDTPPSSDIYNTED